MRLVHANATPQSVDFLRKLVFGLWFILVMADPMVDLAILPYSAFNFVGVLLRSIHKITGPFILTVPFLAVLKLTTLSSLLCVILNRWLIPASIVSCILLTIHQSLICSLGHINHAQFALLYSAYCLACFWVADRTVRRKGGTSVNLNAFPFLAIMAVTCSAYSFMGLYRIVYGGFEIFTSESLIHWITFSSNRAVALPWRLDQLVLGTPWLQLFLKVGFLIGTFFEILAPLCLISHRFRRLFVGYMLSFHIVIFLFMHILFWEQMILYILFLDVTVYFDAFEDKLARIRVIEPRPS